MGTVRQSCQVNLVSAEYIWVLTAALLEISVYWNVTPCWLVLSSRWYKSRKALNLQLHKEGGGALYWGPWSMCKGRLWRRAPPSKGAPLGKLGGASHTGDIERRMKEGSRNEASLIEGALWGEHGGTLLYRGLLSKALKWAYVSVGPLLLGNMEGRSLPGAFERKEKFSLFRQIFMRNLRKM